MSKSIIIKTYRVGNVEIEVRRSIRGNTGVVDFFRMNRYYVKLSTNSVEKTGTFLKDDLRDLSTLLLKLNSEYIEVEEVEVTKIINGVKS